MPIEIRELVIRARVDPGGERRSGAAPPPSRGDSGSRQDVVAACVREVLRVLEDKRER